MAKQRVPPPALPRESIAFYGAEEDAEAIREMLGPGDAMLVEQEIASICAGIDDGSLGIVMIDAALLSQGDISELRKSVSAQPEWSDIPIVLLTDRANFEALADALDFSQIRLVERPLHPLVLARAVRSARQSRWYQRKGQAFSREVFAAEEHYRRLSESLEAGLDRQIGDLEALSERLGQEVLKHRATEEALRESEELYRYTVELSYQMVWTAEPDGTSATIGGRFSEMTGVPEGVPLSDSLPKLVHPDDFDRLMSAWADCLRTGMPHTAEFRMRIADGSYHVFMSRAAPRYDANGTIIRWYGYTEDITEQRAATEALRQAEERYRLAARATNDAIWDWDLATDLVAWSDAAAAYLGTAPLDESDIHWWEEAIHIEDRQRVLRSIYGAINSDKARWSAAYRLRKSDGEYAYVYDRGFIIRDEEGKAVRAVGAVVDLTERRRAEAELRRTQAELIHVSRVSAMGTMASTLAHELNQPLTAVTSYVRGSRRLLANMDDPAIVQVCEALEFAEAGALRAGQIVRRLRELVARGAVAVGPEDLGKLVEDACVLAFVDEHLHGITHSIKIDQDAHWVEVDRIQIQQVLINLIRNAVQALQHADRREVTIAARAHGEDMIEVSVADCGGGIPASVRDALFSPFHSTKTEGMGIGLSISRTIVEAHHGKIWAEDGPDGGAVFRFTLPRAEVPLEELLDAAEGDEEQRQAV